MIELRFFFFCFLQCFIAVNSIGQAFGHIYDAVTGEAVVGAEVYHDQGITSISNQDGKFTLPLFSKESSNIQACLTAEGKCASFYFSKPCLASMYNSIGEKVWSSAEISTEASFSTERFTNGLYFLKAENAMGKSLFSLYAISGIFYMNGSWSPQSELSNAILHVKAAGYKAAEFELNTSNTRNYNLLLRKNTYASTPFTNKLIGKEAFDTLSSSPSRTNISNVLSLKVMYDFTTDSIFFINTKLYNSHFQFARDILHYPYGPGEFNNYQYSNNPNRQYYQLTLNYFKDSDTYTFEFFTGDGASCENVYDCYEKLKQTFFASNNLFFYSTNQSWEDCHEIPRLTANDLFEGQNYQALNLTENYGYLTKINILNIEQADVTRHSIVVTNGIPNDMPVIAGIITSEFQTPLSHINVLSHNRGTPNMALKNAFEHELIDSLENQLVYLKVEGNSFTLRKATIAEAEAFWVKKEPSVPVLLQADCITKGLVNLDTCSYFNVTSIGGKAANFAEMLIAFREKYMLPPVPEQYFAIPFYYYLNHIERHGIDTLIANMLNDERFKADAVYKKLKLQELQERIVASDLNDTLLTLLKDKLGETSKFSNFRFRSSTNAEDIEGFNGAGLYDSYTGKIDSEKKAIDIAVKKVWASLWNYRAFEEREYFKIDHLTCAMGILVHRSFPNEDANGVAISTNPYNVNHGYVVNVQYKEISIVAPEEGIMHDQSIVYDFKLSGEGKYTIEYISTSSIPSLTEHVLTDQELFLLADYITTLKRHYYALLNPDTPYKNFGLDIEFKIDSSVSPRKLYLKQVRLY